MFWAFFFAYSPLVVSIPLQASTIGCAPWAETLKLHHFGSAQFTGRLKTVPAFQIDHIVVHDKKLPWAITSPVGDQSPMRYT